MNTVTKDFTRLMCTLMHLIHINPFHVVAIFIVFNGNSSNI